MSEDCSPVEFFLILFLVFRVFDVRLQKFLNFCLHRVKNNIYNDYNCSVHLIWTNLGKSSIMFAGPQVWQDVPTEIKNYSKHSLKSLYKIFLQTYK